MRKIISILLTISLAFFTSCEKDSEGISKVTDYCSFELLGEETMFVSVGSAFQDPGCKAFEGETDVTDIMETTSYVNANKSGMYSIVYSAMNSDGYPATKVRTVVVYDSAPSALKSAVYANTPKSFRNASGTILQYGAAYPLIIYQKSPGIFQVGDFLAGWYNYRAGYGPGYCVAGEFTLKADNTLELGENKMIGGWADSLGEMTEGKLDPVTGTVLWKVVYAGMTFDVTLTK